MTRNTTPYSIVRIQKRHHPLLKFTSKVLAAIMLLQGIPAIPAFASSQNSQIRQVSNSSFRGIGRTAKPGDFSTDAVREAGIHGGALTPTTEDDASFSPGGNEAFGACMILWNEHKWQEAEEAMHEFSVDYPDDPWVGEAQLHLACFHRFRGEYRQAEEILVPLYENNKGNPIGRKALVRLGRVYFETFRYQAAYECYLTLLQMDPIETEKTFALNWLFHISRVWMSAADNRECGPKAFAYAAWLTDHAAQVGENRAAEQARDAKRNRNESARAVVPALSFEQVAAKYPWAKTRGGAQGMTLSDMRMLLEENGWTMDSRKATYESLCRDVSEENVAILCLPRPDAVQFQPPGKVAAASVSMVDSDARFKGGREAADLGHYLVLLKANKRNAWLIDPENGMQQMDAAALKDLWLRGEEQGLVAYMARGDSRGRPGIPLDSTDEAVFAGGCCGHASNSDTVGCPTIPGVAPADTRGMPSHQVDLANMNYVVADTPLWSDSPIGPDLDLTLTYNNKEASSAKHDIDEVQFYPFGFRWSAPYDGNYAFDPGENILVHFPNGLEVLFDEQVDGSYEVHDQRFRDQFDLTVESNQYVRVDVQGGVSSYYFAPLETQLYYWLPENGPPPWVDPDTGLGIGPQEQMLYRIEDQYGNGVDIQRDMDGHLLKVQSDVTGVSFNYLYDTYGHVTNVYEKASDGSPTGRSASFAYNAMSGGNATLQSITDMDDQTTSFDYDSQVYSLFGGSITTSDYHIVSYTWPNGGTWSFDLQQTFYQGYAQPLELTITDPEGSNSVYNSYSFSAAGPVASKNRNNASILWDLEEDASGVVGSTAIRANDRYGALYSRDGEVLEGTIYGTVSGKRELLFHSVPSEAAGNAEAMGDTPRAEYWYGYESLTNGHRLVTVTNKVYEADTMPGGGTMLTDQWVQSIEQDENLDVVRVEDRIGNEVYFDRTNRLVRAIRIHPDGGSEKTVYEATFTSLGQIETYTVDEGLQNKVELHYATNGLLSRIDYPDGTHEGFGYDPATFFVTEHTNRFGQVTIYQSDHLGRPENIFYPDSTMESYFYGCCAAESVTDRHGVTANMGYDFNKRLDWAVIPMDGDADTCMKFSYMGEGELKTLGYGPSLDDLATRSFDYQTTNGWIRLASRSTPEGKTPESWSYTFSGLPETVTNGVGVVTTYTWNEPKGLLKEKQVDGTPAGLEDVVVSYQYDGLDRLTNIVKTVSGLGEIWREGYAYDERSRIDTVTTRIQNIPGQTNALEYTLGYDYGERGFVTNRTLTVVGSTSIGTAYAYEPDSARLRSVSDPYATVEYGYDPYGRPHVQTNAMVGASSSKTVKTWEFDEYSRLAGLSVSNATSQLWGRTYGYDVERIAATTNSLDGSRWGYAYDYQGQLTEARLYTASNTIARLETWQYDVVGNIETVDMAQPATNPAIRVGTANLLNNADDEIAAYERHKTATLFGRVDATNAVVSLPLASGVPVDQDSRGNWIAPRVPLYPGTNNMVGIQLKAEQAGQNPTYKLATFSVYPVSTNLSYDANGALLTLPDGPTSEPSTLSWNADGRLASVTSNSVEIGKYFYDGLDRRIVKVENGNLVLYLWDGMDVVGVADPGALLKEYYSRGALGLGDVGSLTADTKFSGGSVVGTTLLHANHRGDVVLATDSGGSAVSTVQFSPFGNTLAKSGNYTCRFGFSSKERDASTLIYYGYRYYSSWLQRWASSDPVGLRGGMNLYLFCGNDPINRIDPDGELDAKAAYQYWFDVATDGHTQGGVAGISKAIGASLAMSFIGFWGARTLQENAEKSGTYSVDPLCRNKAIFYGGLAVGQVVLSAMSAFGGNNAIHPWYRYVGPGSRSGFGAGTWVVRGTLGRPPYSSLSVAASKLQIPPISQISQAVRVKGLWKTFVGGGRFVHGNSQWGVGGGIEYRVGRFLWPW